MVMLKVCLLLPFVLAASLCPCSNNCLLQMWHQSFPLASTVSLNFWELNYFLLGIVCSWLVFLACSSSCMLGHWNYFTRLLFSLWENCNRLSCKCVLMLACRFMYKRTRWQYYKLLTNITANKISSVRMLGSNKLKPWISLNSVPFICPNILREFPQSFLGTIYNPQLPTRNWIESVLACCSLITGCI